MSRCAGLLTVDFPLADPNIFDYTGGLISPCWRMVNGILNAGG
jgi:hypothetical protein